VGGIAAWVVVVGVRFLYSERARERELGTVVFLSGKGKAHRRPKLNTIGVNKIGGPYRKLSSFFPYSVCDNFITLL
jgi:hypothetical protein